MSGQTETNESVPQKPVFEMSCVEETNPADEEVYVVNTKFSKGLPVEEALHVLGIAAMGALETGIKLAEAKGIDKEDALGAMGFDK